MFLTSLDKTQFKITYNLYLNIYTTTQNWNKLFKFKKKSARALLKNYRNPVIKKSTKSDTVPWICDQGGIRFRNNL